MSAVHFIPCADETLYRLETILCWLNVVPASQTMDLHSTSIGSMSRAMRLSSIFQTNKITLRMIKLFVIDAQSPNNSMSLMYVIYK